MDDIIGYVKSHSESVQKTAEIFKLGNLDIPCILNESGTRITMKIDDNTTADIPIESAINIQYSDILCSVMKKGGC